MPDVGSVHTDAILSNVSEMYRNAQYVGLEMLPVVAVKKEAIIIINIIQKLIDLECLII